MKKEAELQEKKPLCFLNVGRNIDELHLFEESNQLRFSVRYIELLLSLWQPTYSISRDRPGLLHHHTEETRQTREDIYSPIQTKQTGNRQNQSVHVTNWVTNPDFIISDRNRWSQTFVCNNKHQKIWWFWFPINRFWSLLVEQRRSRKCWKKQNRFKSKTESRILENRDKL